MSLCPPRYFVLYKKTNDQYVPGQLLRKNLSIIFLAWRHYWFPREMTSEEQAQQLNTDDASLPRSKIELLTGWRKLFPAARPIRGTSQIWAVPRRTRKIPTNRKRLISIGHEHSDPCLYWLSVIFFFLFLGGWGKLPPERRCHGKQRRKENNYEYKIFLLHVFSLTRRNKCPSPFTVTFKRDWAKRVNPCAPWCLIEIYFKFGLMLRRLFLTVVSVTTPSNFTWTWHASPKNIFSCTFTSCFLRLCLLRVCWE